MVYYDDGKILIRNMRQSDVPVITQGERDQGWDADGEKYQMRLQHQAEGRSISLVAEYQGQVAGYVNVYPDSQWGAFANRGYPEIVDFGVLEPYRRQGWAVSSWILPSKLRHSMRRWFTLAWACTGATAAPSGCM